MTDKIPQLLTEIKVAQLLGKSVSSLRRDRWLGGGIPFRKLGSHVRYDLEDVLNWINKHPLQNSTSEE